MIAAYNLEYLLDNVHKMDLISLGVVVLGGYIGILVLYSVLTYIQYTVKYHKAKEECKTVLHSADEIRENLYS